MRKIIICVLVLTGLAVVAWSGRLGYRYWKQEHLIKLARHYASKSDLSNAALCLQKALQSNPKNVEASRMSADLSEAIRSLVALIWRRRVAELQPEVARNRYEWARTALIFGDLQSASDALSGVKDKDKQSVDYAKAAGALAWASRQYSLAESNYLDAVRLEPANVVSRLNLALSQLVSTNSAKAENAKRTLEELKTNATVRVQVLRQLTMVAIRLNHVDEAVKCSTELQSEAQCSFADRLVHLDVLDGAKNPEFASGFSKLQEKSATNRFEAYEFASWMYSRGKTNDGLIWLQSLSPSIRTNMPTPILIGEGFITLGKWEQVQALTKGHNWGELEYLRHVFNSKASRAQGDTATATLEWQAALKASSKHIEALNDLVRRTAGWGWQKEMDETLWSIMEHYPTDQRAFLALYTRLFAAGDSQGLRNLLAEGFDATPGNSDLENNLAILLLLLSPDEAKGHDLAHDVFKKDPKNPVFLSTYAYSLHLKKKSDDAVKLFNTLTPEQLTNPPVAAYFGIILAETGRGAEAKKYLQLAGGAKLLLEESKLVKKAWSGI